MCHGCHECPALSERANDRASRMVCYDPRVLDTQIMATLQATRMKKGMLIKIGQDLFRVLEL